MKKITKYSDISKALTIALAVIITFSMTACFLADDEGGGKLPINYGDKLALSGDVFLEIRTEEETELGYDVTHIPFSLIGDSLTIKNTYGGSGKVSGGNLSYSIGIPTGQYPLNFVSLFKKKDYGFFDSGEAEGVVLNLQFNYDNFSSLHRGETTIVDSNGVISITEESVIYIYVDKDVSVSGVGMPGGSAGKPGIINGKPYTKTEKVEHLSLKLKAGWNTVYERSESSIRRNMGMGNILESYDITETYKMSLENPSDLKWCIPATP
jgi:hypothetical protein